MRVRAYAVARLSTPLYAFLSRQCFPEIIDQPRKHPMCVAPAIELAVEPRPKSRRVPDVLERDFRRSALEPQAKKCFRARAVIDLDPSERMGRRKIDDFDDRFVTRGVALKGHLVPGALAGPVVGSCLDRHTPRQPLGHPQRIGYEIEDPVDRGGNAGGVCERNRAHGARNMSLGKWYVDL